MENKVIITGAGGTIGSELARLCPGAVMLEQSQSSLFVLRSNFDQLIKSHICDVTVEDQVDRQFGRYASGSTIFHCAAHKHVPICEDNVAEAVRNNFLGTKIIADACERHGAAKMVLVSTDKAVNPVSVMGATKMLAEHYIKECAAGNPRTKFCTVRFGNVKGSSGSVYEIWEKQAAGGGPITLTDPDMTRYFMSLEEAAELVLRAAEITEGGETFVFDMGEPKNMGELANEFASEHNVEVKITGARPGERKHEQLTNSDTEQVIWLSSKTNLYAA